MKKEDNTKKPCPFPLVRSPFLIYKEQRRCPEFCPSGCTPACPCIHYDDGQCTKT